jgi:predicted ArsR family transcriptional regulator
MRESPLAARAAAENFLDVRELLVAYITATGSVIKAAQALGVNPNAVRHHLRKHGIAVSTRVHKTVIFTEIAS